MQKRSKKLDETGPPEKKVTERLSRVGIVSKPWETRARPDLPHRVWAAEGWSSAPAWVSAWMEVAQTGVVVRLLLERAPWTGLRKNYPTVLLFGVATRPKEGTLPHPGAMQKKGDQGRSYVTYSIDTPWVPLQTVFRSPFLSDLPTLWVGGSRAARSSLS